MKNPTLVLVVLALVAATIEFQTNRVATAHASRSGPPEQGYVLKRISSSAVHHALTAFPRLRFWDSTSGNWSGYAVPLDTRGVTDTFSNVQGSWKVPTVTGATGPTSDTYSSAWVGLDGYTDGTVEQVGSEQDWTGSAQENYVWFETYPSAAYEIMGFPISPGDSISAQVQYTGQITVRGYRGRTMVESVFRLTIVNTTKNVTFTVPTTYTTIPSAVRSSAEWVMEAPTGYDVLPLADFGTISFSNCEAASVHSGGKLVPINFWTPDPMTMIDPNGGGSVPSSLSANGQAFSATWSPQ
jgi:hypothetical protein